MSRKEARDYQDIVKLIYTEDEERWFNQVKQVKSMSKSLIASINQTHPNLTN